MGSCGTETNVNGRPEEWGGVSDLGEMMNCWAEDGQMEREFGKCPKIAPFSTFGRVIVLLIRHMFWEWARGVFNRIKITISAFFS